MDRPSPHRDGERGFATLALLGVLFPLMFLVGSYLQSMTARQSRLQLEIAEEQALMTAEAGIDITLNEARRGTLRSGYQARYEFATTLSLQSHADVVCDYLGWDDEDNDGDGDIDEPDEDVFRVTSTGRHGHSLRRVASYLGFTNFMPEIHGAITLTNPNTTVDINGTPTADGRNRDLRGGIVGSGDVYGIVMTPPGTVADLSAEVTDGEMTHVEGLGGAPSLGPAPFLDVELLVGYTRNAASVVLVNSRLQEAVGTLRDPEIAFRQGDLRINGNHTSYGVLVVDGDIEVVGNATWNGVVVCTGNVDLGAGTFTLNGAMILGPESPELSMRGTADLNFSAEGVALAAGLLGRYTAFNGWQEISTN